MSILYFSGLTRQHLHEEWLEKERVAQEEFSLKREREEAALKRKEEEEVNYISARVTGNTSDLHYKQNFIKS